MLFLLFIFLSIFRISSQQFTTNDDDDLTPPPNIITYKTSEVPVLRTDFFTNSLPEIQTTLSAPRLTPEFAPGFPPLTPLWDVPSMLPTLPTPPPFTFPTFPTLPTIPPPTIKPVNITIDPEAIMDVPEIIAHWGYPVETHKVVTPDGYILTLHRIPHGINKTSSTRTKKPVVFLQHGLLCTSSIWLLNLPHQSAGYIFADQGYDVWLGNMRGNTYSKSHLRMNSMDPKFWKFSWEEMARYDLESMVDYVLKSTKQEQLYYIGHSQGALTMFAKMSQDGQFSRKIRKFFAMAPVARMSHVKGLFHDLGEIYDQYNMVYQVFGDGEFLTNNIFTKLMTDILCDQANNNPICENFIFAVSGPNSNQFNNSRIGIYLAHNPAGTSSRNMLHFAQMVKTRRMARFDQGRDLNLKYYGHVIPPEYDLRKINSSIYLFYSDLDWLANSNDVEGYLIPMLPKNSLKKSTKLKDFNHNDFLWGMRARAEIYEKIIDTITLDQRKIKLQDGVQKYFDSLPTSFPSNLSDTLLQTVRNETMEFELD
ncbi:unnamed protein product [Caenorhabditis angaria]|uniref:Partial AB-hydrolase lipase domain-containing protein n=1 Tax=Caenorhabditis angaria TaxID=860376 RepID=A0A9P1N5G0_9PELO|nr:unnamed protein product [Caenorhabditis angaria]